MVALRKESVDRNNRPDGQKYINRRSLSARRAWIEMLKITITVDDVTVALRKESVDRNINQEEDTGKTVFVALRKESVDRNC